ncbi:MAG: molecular chaperone HtpG, partial [Duncaniella sp.]|nr:molecular chaperone HtpG [Duncaniella sp.]
MKDMAATQPGMAFYAEMPDSYNLIVNTANPLVSKMLTEAEEKVGEGLKPLREAVDADNKKLTDLRAAIKDNKPTDEQKAEETALMASVDKSRKEQEKLVSAFAGEHPVIRQAIDLALLSNGLLQGRELSEFVRRSFELL